MLKTNNVFYHLLGCRDFISHLVSKDTATFPFWHLNYADPIYIHIFFPNKENAPSLRQINEHFLFFDTMEGLGRFMDNFLPLLGWETQMRVQEIDNGDG